MRLKIKAFYQKLNFYYKINLLHEKGIETTVSIDFQEDHNVLQFLKDRNLRDLTACLSCMFEYTTDLMTKEKTERMGLHVYYDTQNIYFALTHPIGKTNLHYIKPNNLSSAIKDMVRENYHLSRKEEIIDGVYTQILTVHI